MRYRHMLAQGLALLLVVWAAATIVAAVSLWQLDRAYDSPTSRYHRPTECRPFYGVDSQRWRECMNVGAK